MVWGYEEWQSVLCSEFLARHEGPTVFFVDDTQLARIRPEVDDAAIELAEAVRSRVRLTDGRPMFAPILLSYRQWRRGPRLDAPPVLPLIALTVLAATRMRSDAEGRSTNYYLRLAQALAPAGDGEFTEILRKDLREEGAFVDVVEMWRGLHDWIEAQDGAVGTSTIRDHPHLLRIGYPLSQALARQSDRIALTRFFHALDFAPSAVPDAQVISSALDIWTAAPQNRLSETFMHALGDTDLRALLAAVVEAHARAWDGRVLTGEGKQRIAMRLSVDLDAWQARWLFPVPASGPEVLTLRVPDSAQEVILTALSGIDYYSAVGSPAVSAEMLLSGFRLRGDEFTAEFPPSPVLFFRLDPQTGAWTSSSGMLPFEDHLAAVSSSHAAEFQQLLREAAVDGWSYIHQRRRVLLPGYALFGDVRFADGEVLEHALAELPRLRLVGVAPTPVPRARLVRGLPVARSISATHYLVGGEPDLLLPSGPDPRLATVTLDGRRERLQANGFPLELRRFISGVGRHVVDADGQELSFTTLEEGPDPSAPVGTATLGWTLDEQMSEEHGSLAVTGACVSDPGLHPVLARRGRDESWLLHDGGRAERLPEPEPPPFLSSIDIELHSPRFEINASATANWLAQRRGSRWRITEIGASEPEEYDLDIDILDAWKRVGSDPNGAQLWSAQLGRAERTA